MPIQLMFTDPMLGTYRKMLKEVEEKGEKEQVQILHAVEKLTPVFLPLPVLCLVREWLKNRCLLFLRKLYKQMTQEAL